MIGSTRNIKVYARTAPTDLRKGFNGLYGLVEQELGRDPMSGDIYLFVNRRRKSTKALIYDGTGLYIYAKRLARGNFACLWRDGGASTLSLSMSELLLFLECADLTAHLPLSPERAEKSNSIALII